MNSHHADIEDNTRLDIVVTANSRRVVDGPTGTVHELTVVDQRDMEFRLLAGPDATALTDAEIDERYEIAGLLGVDPTTESELVRTECPDCGGHLRAGTVPDAVGPDLKTAALALRFNDVYGIVDAATDVQRVHQESDGTDDWVPMREQTDSGVAVPRFVCESCGREFQQLGHDTPAEGGHAVEEESAVMSASMNKMLDSEETVGLSAGGAKDVENFRENIANAYTPQPGAIGDEGLFYDYHFETGERTESDALFAPRYATATSEHPLSGEVEQYLSVGLDSTLSMAEFERPRLELVAVLDVSGSMDSAFDSYYYDEHGHRQEGGDDAADTKLDAATQSLCALTEQLHDEDRLGVVLYNSRAHVAKPLRDVGATDMPAIRQHIKGITAGGGTNLADGFEAAVDMLATAPPDSTAERRVVFMTDMMPNTGTTGESELTELFTDAAAGGIHSTFIGMGLDANADLAETLSGIRGANHYFIHSASEFEQRLGEEFDYMVTPLVYDLNLDLEADGYEIEAVHGSPSADAATDRLMHVGTLFPSAKQDGEARGGVVLVRLRETNADAELSLVASWTERDGGEYTERVTVDVPDESGTYAHEGVRKAVALARYARELRTWAADLHDRADAATGVDDWLLPDQRGQHERESVPLVVPDRYTERFDQLRSYLADEMAAVDDESMQQEVELLETLCQQAPATPREVSD